MNLLNDIITYVRRIVKSPSDAILSTNLIIDYINRFWLMDVDARIQLFDFKTKYQFITQPAVDQYNIPLYDVQVQPGNQTIASFPVYQGLTGNCLINGVPVGFETRREAFLGVWFNYLQNIQTFVVGDGTAGPYTIPFPILPNATPPVNPPYNAILRGHVDITGIISTGNNIDPILTDNTTAATNIPVVPTTSVYSAVYITSLDSNGNNVVVADSGQFLLTNINCGLLMTPGKAPNGNSILPGGYSSTSNVVNYLTGTAYVTFPSVIPVGVNINATCSFFQTGLPRAILFYNNIITLRAPPAIQYLVELDAYLTPAAFLNTEKAAPFGYMSEYIARGAARKLLSDTGDWEQFDRYEPLFKEQELLVWKRSQRQFTANRTETIYSRGHGNQFGYGNWGGNY